VVRNVLASVALAALVVAVVGAGGALAVPYLSKREAKHQATIRVKRDMRRGRGHYYEVNACHRRARNLVGCDYYYEFHTTQANSDRPDSYCEGRMMVRKGRSRFTTYGRKVHCDSLEDAAVSRVRAKRASDR
jgi:hypothetical protein